MEKNNTTSKTANCPSCWSDETKFEVADRWQCQNCGYRFLIDDDGNIKDFMPWETAGKKGRRARKLQ